MKIENFDKVNLKVLRDEINSALAAVADRHGIAIHCGNASYATTNASFKLELNAKSATGQVISQERKDFARYASMFGLEASDLDKTIVVRGEQFKIVGLKPGSPKFPILATNPRSKTFKFQIDTVKRALGRTV